MSVRSRDVRRGSTVWEDLMLRLRGVILDDELILGGRQANASGAVTINVDRAPIHELTLTGNVTSVTFSNLTQWQVVIVRWIQQAGAGGLTVAFGAGTPVALLRGGAFNMVATASRSTVSVFYYNGTNMVEWIRTEGIY